MVQSPFAVPVLLVALGSTACASSNGGGSSSSNTVQSAEDDAGVEAEAEPDVGPNEPEAPAESSDDDDDPAGAPDDDGLPTVQVPDFAIPAPVDDEPDASTEPEPSASEPEPNATQPEPSSAEPETEPAAPEPEPTVHPEPAKEPEPTASEPEPAVVEPEPVIDPTVEPVERGPVEPEPDVCIGRPQCDLACQPGFYHPADADGCVDGCSCAPLDPVCTTCDSDEQCIHETSKDGTRYRCADVISDCASVAPCGCFEDYGDCTLSEAGLCECTVPDDPCGGCSDGKRCIYQQWVPGGGGSRYLCAAANDCKGPDDCSCIVQQGQCQPDPNRGVCACSPDLISR